MSNRRFTSQRLKWALQALAADASEQLAIFPDWVAPTDELALAYDDAYREALTVLTAELTVEQRAALDRIDGVLEAMSASGGAVWDIVSLETSPQWDSVRTAARAALSLFAWSFETPPVNLGLTYIRGR